MRRLLFAIPTLASLLVPAFAQQDDDSSRGVARVSVIAGDVAIRRGDSGDNVAAALNAPLVAQDRVSTGPGARAEVQFDFANMIRLGSNTEIRLAELQSQRFQVNVASGLVTFRVWQDSSAEVDLNTPVASIRPLRKGEYRVQVLEDGSTEVTVRDGEVDIYTPQGSRKVREGRTVTIRREGNGETSFFTGNQLPNDSWDQWNRSRDRELASSRSNQYMPQGVYGGEQLDSYGDWSYNAPYGYVWSPRVAAGWAPYRTGRWTWLDWYGWSWVSYDPWGWAPYHYGRWFNSGGRWCWWPGARGVRSYWSPALVSFVGFGRGGGGLSFGIGFNFGNVGWVPLAPFETYNRWWGRNYYGGRNVNNITVVNNVNITNVYRNARVNGGVSYVEANQFNRGVAYAGNGGVRAASAGDLGNASEFRGPIGIGPNRESVRFNNDDGARGSAARFSAREDQGFTARRQVASVDRVPFDQQARGFESRQSEGVRGGAVANDGFRRVGGDNAVQRQQPAITDGVRGGGNSSNGFVSRQGSDGGVRGGTAGADGFRRIGPDSGNGVRGGASTDGFVNRQGVEGGVRGGSSDGGARGSGWQRFGDAEVNGGVRGGGSTNRDSQNFVQRDGGTRGGGDRSDLNSSSSSRSRGVGAVDVSPRIVERGNSDIGGGSTRGSQGSGDPFGGGASSGRRGGGDSGSGWSSFGGMRGGGNSSSPQQSSPRSMERSMPSGGGFGGGRGSSPQMSAPSGGGSRGGGSMAPSGGGGGRGGGGGGGAAPASRGGGGGRRGGGQ